MMNVNGRPITHLPAFTAELHSHRHLGKLYVMCTLIRGQKLPIFSGSGMNHNELAAQIVRQSRLSGDENDNFAIVFAAIGAKNDVADYFRKCFADAGVLSKVVMIINL